MTSVDRNCLQTIARCKNLQFLHLEQTNIGGKDILNMAEHYKKLHNKTEHPLVQLHVGAKREEWKSKAISQLLTIKNQEVALNKVDNTAGRIDT